MDTASPKDTPDVGNTVGGLGFEVVYQPPIILNASDKQFMQIHQGALLLYRWRHSAKQGQESTCH